MGRQNITPFFKKEIIQNTNTMKLNNYFDKIICINLDRRSDRWKEIQVQFKKAGLSVQRFSAVDGNPRGYAHVKDDPTGERSINAIKNNSFGGVAGCIASHTDIWKMAKKNKWKNVLIIEDDCDFVHELQQQFTERINEVPQDWDLLYFGGVHETRGGKFNPRKLSKHVVTCERMITTTCYAIKDTSYDLALDIVFEQHPWFHTAIDGYLAAYIQPKCKAFAFHPPLAWQRSSFSDIQGGPRDYSKMMKENNIKE